MISAETLVSKKDSKNLKAIICKHIINYRAQDYLEN